MNKKFTSALLAALLLTSSLSAFSASAEEPAGEADEITVPFADIDPVPEEKKDSPEVLSDKFLSFSKKDQSAIGDKRRKFNNEYLFDNFNTVYSTLAEVWNHGVYYDVIYRADTANSGVADTRGTGNSYESLITMYTKYYASQSYTEVDSITHELTHVCQVNYRTGYGGQDTDDTGSWIVEGMTDYSRYKYGQYPDGFALPAYSKSQSYTDSYRVTARFFVWIEENICPTLAEQLNEALRTEIYNSQFFMRITGYSLKDLWAMYAADNGRIIGANGAKTSGAVIRGK